MKWVVASVCTIAGLVGIELVACIVVIVGALAVIASVSASNLTLESLSTNTDALLLMMALVELLALLAVVPWWFHVGKRGIGLVRRRKTPNRLAQRGLPTQVKRVLSVVAMALGAQLAITVALNVVLPLFPQVMESYDEMVESAGIDTFTVCSFLAVVVAGPLLEETLFRGVAFQFALRAVTPSWSKRLQPWQIGMLRIGTQQFWVANVVQACVFGIAHLNVVQFSYSLVFGLVLGWVFWRTGKLRYTIGLHMAFNLLSYAIGLVPDVSGVAAIGLGIGAFVGGALLLAAGIWGFRRATETECLAPAAD